MKKANFDEVMKTFFEDLGIDPSDFHYDETTRYYISDESFTSEKENDIQEYYLVVKFIGENSGTVVTGFSDGINFYEADLLGQINFDGNKWERI